MSYSPTPSSNAASSNRRITRDFMTQIPTFLREHKPAYSQRMDMRRSDIVCQEAFKQYERTLKDQEIKRNTEHKAHVVSYI